MPSTAERPGRYTGDAPVTRREAATVVPPPLRRSTKAIYGLGQLAEGMKNTSFELFLFFYYNQVLGLSGTLTGLATFVALLCDAVADPVAGSLSDSFRHRWGRRHPFIYGAAVPLGVAFAFLFRPPTGLGQMGLFIWLVVFAVLARAVLTIYHVPHLALGAELSRDYRERTSIVAFRTLFAVLGSAIATVVGLGWFFRATAGFPNGQMNVEGYPPYGLFCAALMTAAVLASGAGTHARIPFLPPAPPHPLPFTLRRVAGEMRGALSNGSFRALFAGLVLFFVMRGVQITLGLHMGTFFWMLTTRQILEINVALLVGLVSGIPFWTRVATRLDKKPTFLLGVSWFSLFSLAPPLFKIVDWLPPAGTGAYLAILWWMSFLAAFGGAAALIAAGSMMADVADEHELDTGHRQEGIFFGAVAFAGKSASGLGHQIAGLGIDLIGFPPQAMPGSVPAERLVALGVFYGPGIAILAAMSLVVLARYRLDRGAHEAIAAALASRRA